MVCVFNLPHQQEPGKLRGGQDKDSRRQGQLQGLQASSHIDREAESLEGYYCGLRLPQDERKVEFSCGRL